MKILLERSKKLIKEKLKIYIKKCLRYIIYVVLFNCDDHRETINRPVGITNEKLTGFSRKRGHRNLEKLVDRIFQFRGYFLTQPGKCLEFGPVILLLVYLPDGIIATDRRYRPHFS